MALSLFPMSSYAPVRSVTTDSVSLLLSELQFCHQLYERILNSSFHQKAAETPCWLHCCFSEGKTTTLKYHTELEYYKKWVYELLFNMTDPIRSDKYIIGKCIVIFIYYNSWRKYLMPNCIDQHIDYIDYEGNSCLDNCMKL